MIHSTACVHPGAVIGKNVTIGPFSMIGENVIIGDETSVGSHTIIDGWTKIGKNNEIGHHTVIGVEPQDLKYHGEKSYVQIGNYNKIREFVTIHRGTDFGGGVTRIGDNNLLMSYVHVAHDCQIGNHVIFSNSVQLAGHVQVDDFAVLGGICGVHQFVRVGKMAMIGALSPVVKGVIPYSLVYGNPCKAHGINIVGMQRNGIEEFIIEELKKAFLLFYNDTSNIKDLEKIKNSLNRYKQIEEVFDFIQNSKRGITGGI